MRPIALAAVFVLLAAPASAAELRVAFPGLRPEGRLSIAIFRSAEDWKRRARPVWSRIVPVTAAEARVAADLPPGDYAVMAYHDRNGNGRLDTLPVGLPTEPYGFSNDARGVFGPPEWRAAAFRVESGGADQVIRLR